jgi:hypothetical protein
MENLRKPIDLTNPADVMKVIETETLKSTYLWKQANYYKRQYEYTKAELNSFRAVITAFLMGQNRFQLTVTKKNLQRVIDKCKSLSVKRTDDPETGDLTFSLVEIADQEEHNKQENKKAILIS